MKEKSLKLNVILNISRTILSLIFPLITFPYSSRVLGPEGTGKVAYVSSIISYFVMFANLGIGIYGTREIAKIRDDSFAVNKLFKELFLFNLISTVCSYLVFFILIFTIPNFQNYRNLFLIMSATIGFNLIGVEWLYSAMEDYVYITIRSLIFQVIGIILLFVLVKDQNDIPQYAALSVITNVGSNILNFINSKKYISFSQKCKINLKQHIKPIFVLFSTTLAVSVYTVLDTTMLGIMKGDEVVGNYNAATKLSRMIISIFFALASVFIPRMSNYVEHNKEKYNKLLNKISNFYFMLSIPCFIGIMLLANPIISLFCGEKFTEAPQILQILSIIIFIVPCASLFQDQILIPMRKEKLNFYTVIIASIFNFIMNLVLIPIFSAIGAAIASVTAELIGIVGKYYYSRKYITDLNTIFKYIFQYFISGICMLIEILLFKYFVGFDQIYKLLVCVLLSVFVYGGLLLIFKNEYFISISNTLFNKIMGKK